MRWSRLRVLRFGSLHLSALAPLLHALMVVSCVSSISALQTLSVSSPVPELSLRCRDLVSIPSTFEWNNCFSERLQRLELQVMSPSLPKSIRTLCWDLPSNFPDVSLLIERLPHLENLSLPARMIPKTEKGVSCSSLQSLTLLGGDALAQDLKLFSPSLTELDA